MANNQTQPTVLVKKADGTFVRMTLAELESLKKQLTTNNEQLTSKDATSNKKDDDKMIDDKMIKSDTGKPDKRQVTGYGLRVTERWNKDDAKSLLDQSDGQLPQAPTAVSHNRQDQVDEIISRLGFSAPQQFANRLRSAIQLYLKEVRSEEQTKEVLLRSIKDGGLGLTEGQAKKVVDLCDQGKNGKIAIKKLDSEAIELYREPPVPATSTPFNAFARKHDANIANKTNIANASTPQHRPTPLRSPLVRGTGDAIAPLRLRSTAMSKPTVHDIAAPPLEMGPVDEIRFMDLTEYRRFSTDSSQSAVRLFQKFVNLKEESYLLYLEAISAWADSPLYNECMERISESLANGKPLQTVLSDPKGIQPNELKAIIKMEEKI